MAELALSSTQVNRAALTPMMQHYIEMKEQYPHAVMLYRLGDFFEAFFEDAELISRELELVLTGRDGGKAIGRIAMAGIPHHALDRYANQLVEKGYSIAVCDQMEAASEAQGLVRREVTRVITPGTVIEEGMLAAKKNNFLVAIANGADNWGLACTDISTGEFFVTQLNGSDLLIQELLRLQPAEVLIPIDVPNPQLFRGSKADKADVFWEGISKKNKSILPEPYNALPESFCYTPRSQSGFALAEAKQRILDTFKVRSLEGFGCKSLPLAIRAAGGILEYLESTQKSVKMPLQGISTYAIADYLILDNQTRRNLEITQTVRDGTYFSSLLWALDKTTTGMGSRALRRWLLQPLKDIAAINERLDTITELFKQHSLRKNLRSCLSQIYDIERLCSRIGAGTANGRDLIAVAVSLERMRDVADVVAKSNSIYLKALQSVPSELLQLGSQLQKTLVEEPPIYITEGNIIRSGVNEQLDFLRQQSRDDVEWLAAFEKQEKERTGINTLKVGFNKAFGALQDKV